MRLKVNGEIREFRKEIKTISELLVELNIERPERVAVEKNKKIIMLSDFANAQVKEDDNLEIVSF